MTPEEICAYFDENDPTCCNLGIAEWQQFGYIIKLLCGIMSGSGGSFALLETVFLDVDDAVAVGLGNAGPIPPEAVGAEIQVQMNPTTANVYALSDGQIPTNSPGLGIILEHLGRISLGITPSGYRGDVNEINNFLAIASVGADAVLVISYYARA